LGGVDMAKLIDCFTGTEKLAREFASLQKQAKEVGGLDGTINKRLGSLENQLKTRQFKLSQLTIGVPDGMGTYIDLILMD